MGHPVFRYYTWISIPHHFFKLIGVNHLPPSSSPTKIEKQRWKTKTEGIHLSLFPPSLFGQRDPGTRLVRLQTDSFFSLSCLFSPRVLYFIPSRISRDKRPLTCPHFQSLFWGSKLGLGVGMATRFAKAPAGISPFICEPKGFPQREAEGLRLRPY